MEPTSIDPQDRFDRIKIPRSEDAHFPDEWRELLLLAFPKANPIRVLGRLSGYSDEQVWSVATQIGLETQLFVVKIGLRQRIEREYEKSEKVIGGGLYGNPVTPGRKIDHPTNPRWSLMPSTLAGSDKADTLLTHLMHGDASDMEEILKKIFTNQNKWRENMRPELMSFEDYYDRLLPEHVRVAGVDGAINNAPQIDAITLFRNPTGVYKMLEGKGIVELRDFYLEKQEDDVLTLTPQRVLHAGTFWPRVKYELAPGQHFHQDNDKLMPSLFGQNPRTRFDLLRAYAQGAVPGMNKTKNNKFFSLRRAGLKFPDPIEFLPDLLKADVNLRLALNHGDLNLQNILIASDKKTKSESAGGAAHTGASGGEEKQTIDSVWLIDFADVTRGPALLDFQWLEVQVIIRLLTPVADDIQLSVPKLIELFKYLHECGTDFSEALDARLRKPYNILRQLRRFAQEHLLNGWSEYYHGLVICLLGSLRFKRLIEKGQLSKSAPRIAFLSAATLLCWTDVLSKDDLKRVSEILHPGQPIGSDPPVDEKPVHENKEPSETKADKVPPTVDKSSIPTKIFVQQHFFVKGKAHPKAKLQVIAEGPPVTIWADEQGRWEAKVVLKRAGVNSLSVWDDNHKLKSAEVLLTALEEATIDKYSLPAQIRQGEKFSLRGKAQPNALIHLYTNRQQQPVAASTATPTGSWQMDVVIAEAGVHELFAWDKSNDVRSAPLAITISPTMTKNKRLLVTSLLAAALVVAIGLTSFAFPQFIVHISDWFSINTANPPTPTAPAPTVEAPAPSWNTTPQAACIAIKEEKLNVSASENSGPYSFDGGNGVTGFDIALLRKVLEHCASLGVNLDDTGSVDDYLIVKQIPVSRRKEEIQKPEVAIVIGSVGRTPERCDQLAYICTDVYAVDEQALVVQDPAITTYCDPALSAIVVISGTTGDSTFDKYQEECRSYQSDFKAEKRILTTRREDALQAVTNKDVLAYKANKDLLRFVISNDSEFSSLKIIPGGPDEPLVMWLRADKSGLKALINNTFKVLANDVKSVQALCEQYFTGYGKDCTQFPIQRTPNTFLLGTALASSGDQQPLARDQRVGFEIALNELNPQLQKLGIQLVSKPEDAGSKRESALTAFTSLLKQNVIAIIGPTYSFQLFAVFQDETAGVAASPIPIISTSATADDAAKLGPNNFRTSLGVKNYTRYVVDAAINEQPTIASAMLAYKANDEFTASEARALITGTLGHANVTLAPPITYTNDYTAVVAAVNAQNPDLFMLSALFDDGRQILELLTKTTYTGTIIIGNGLNTTEIFKYCKAKCNGIYIAQAYSYHWQNAANQKFVAAYQKYYDEHHAQSSYLPKQPSQIMAQMYTAVQVIEEALLDLDNDYAHSGQRRLKKFDLNDSNQLQQLRVALNEKLLTNAADTPETRLTIDTPLGKESWFDQDGDIQQDGFCVARIRMTTAQEGEFEIINPTEYGLNCNKL